jgi:colanic acid biosynthesis glycosyl transferase WcaI
MGRRALKVLVVTQYFWPESFRINDLVLGLKERGHDMTVLTGVPNYPRGTIFPGYGILSPATETYQGVAVCRVPLCPRGTGQGWRLAVNYFSFALSASVFGPLRLRGAFDAIVVYEPSPITVGIPAIVVKWLKGAPILFWVQDLWPESLSATGAVKSKWMLNSVANLVRFIYDRCDRVLVQSKAFTAPIENLGTSAEKILYFPNSAEDLYRPMQLALDAPERETMPQGFRVMFAGNIGAAQDFETILEAAEKLKTNADIHWVILGDGRMRGWVDEQMRLRGIKKNFHLLGKHPVESMPRWFSLADAMLVTLKREPIFALTIPAKLQSYLACAKPIIAALDGEGARIIEESGAGLVAPCENAEALAQSVLAVHRMSLEERARMGEKGHAYFRQHFEREKLLDQLEAWMLELTAERVRCAS